MLAPTTAQQTEFESRAEQHLAKVRAAHHSAQDSLAAARDRMIGTAHKQRRHMQLDLEQKVWLSSEGITIA